MCRISNFNPFIFATEFYLSLSEKQNKTKSYIFLFSSRNYLGAQAETARTVTQNTIIAMNTSFTVKCGRAPKVIFLKKNKKQGRKISA